MIDVRWFSDYKFREVGEVVNVFFPSNFITLLISPAEILTAV